MSKLYTILFSTEQIFTEIINAQKSVLKLELTNLTNAKQYENKQDERIQTEQSEVTSSSI